MIFKPNHILYKQDLRIPAINVGAIRESPLHLGLDKAICVSPNKKQCSLRKILP